MSNRPDQAWSVFEGIFIHICDKHAPFKQIKVPNKAPSWLNDDYLVLRKKLEQAKIHAQSTKSPTDWDAYRDFRNTTNNLAKRLKREFYESSIRNAGSDTGKLWKVIKSILPSTKKVSINKIRSGYEILTDGSAIANEFNNFVASIGRKLTDTLIQQS